MARKKTAAAPTSAGPSPEVLRLRQNQRQRTGKPLTPAKKAAAAAEEPAGLKEGDRVMVKPGMEHDASHLDRPGTVRQISTPALGIEFDDEPGVTVRWYTDAELAPAAAEPTAEPGTQPTEPPADAPTT